MFHFLMLCSDRKLSACLNFSYLVQCNMRELLDYYCHEEKNVPAAMAILINRGCL